MTNEKYIEILNALKECERAYQYSKEEVVETLDTAIQALEQTELNPSYNSVKTELKPCGDCISRTDALNAFKPKGISEELWMESNTYKVLTKLPPVTPKAESGEVSVLDKIVTKIEDTGAYEQEVNGKTEFLEGVTYCLNIINKYKAESEDEE